MPTLPSRGDPVENTVHIFTINNNSNGSTAAGAGAEKVQCWLWLRIDYWSCMQTSSWPVTARLEIFLFNTSVSNCHLGLFRVCLPRISTDYLKVTKSLPEAGYVCCIRSSPVSVSSGGVWRGGDVVWGFLTRSRLLPIIYNTKAAPSQRGAIILPRARTNYLHLVKQDNLQVGDIDSIREEWAGHNSWLKF